MIAEIIPNTKTWNDTEIFSYNIPSELESNICVGSIVSIPFGRRHIRGVVKQIHKKATDDMILKDVSGVNKSFFLPENYVKISEWLANYFLCSLGEAIDLFLPTQLKRPRKQLKVEGQKFKAAQAARLSAEQQEIFEKLKEKLNQKNKKPALIHGVTGSGKTEIYLKLTAETIKSGKQVVVLVPEIILTPQTVERFEAVFGDKITLMHSNLSKSERLQCYHDFYTGDKPIIIGPRSALLVPSNKIGLIIVDEEQEDSYKQDASPRYHAVTLAEKIAAENNALLLLGSATPRIETYFRATNGEIDLFTLSSRYQKKTMPVAIIVNLKDEIRAENFSPISTRLKEEIGKVLENKRQILLFLNRRGSATFVSCRDCGYIVLCKNCSIPMVYHVNGDKNYLNCHHCDAKLPVPEHCPDCGGLRIKYFGTGIERIETEIRKIFPSARVTKIDSRTITKKSDYDTFYQQFKNHEIDVVIGTQMIAKGLDIPAVDLVGIVSADTGLHLPHYLATEKSFGILTQVSGRSGRKKEIGKTIIQTYWPDSPAVIAAADHNYKLFYDFEIAERERYHYPPFTHMVRVIVENSNKDHAKEKIDAVFDDIKKKDLATIGPGACFYTRLHGRYRYHVIIKTEKLPNLAISELAKKYRELTWDTDPTNLL